MSDLFNEPTTEETTVASKTAEPPSPELTPFLNKVYNGDTFDLIKKLKDSSISCTIVDPPFGDHIGYGRKGKEILNNEDESINYRFLDAIKPKMKPNTTLYLFSNYKFEYKIREYAIKTGWTFRATCVMVKNNFGMGYGFRHQYELCLILENGKATYNGKDMSDVWFMKHVQHNDDSHPHQKDYDIIRKIILHSTKENEVVFDGFSGSATVAVACWKEKRFFISAELDEKWYKLGEKKLNDLMSQKTMF